MSSIPALPKARPTGDTLRPVSAARRFATLRVIGALVLREMASTYGRTPGGYLWAVAEPAAGIFLLTLIFSFAGLKPPIGSNFPMFYATGIVPFLYYMDLSGKVSQSLNFSRPLLEYPSVTFFDALAGRIITNMLSGLLVVYVIFVVLYVTADTRTDPQFYIIMNALGMATALGVGIGTMNCFMMMRFSVWNKLWAIVNKPLFIVSCIFFIFDAVPDYVQEYLWYNPLIHVVGMMRRGFYPSYTADYVSPAYVYGLSLVLFAAGFALLLRYHRDLLSGR